MFFDIFDGFCISWKYKTMGKKAVSMKYEMKIALPVYKMAYSFLFMGCAQLRAWNSVGESPTV